MHASIPLETECLILRAFAPDDIEDLHAQLSDPDVMAYYPSALSREESEKWLQGVLGDCEANGYGMLAMCLRETGEYIGQVGIMRRVIDEREIFYLSYLVCKSFWGHGYATEAVRRILEFGFDTLGIQRVQAIIRPDNARSILLAERVGMTRESTTMHGGREHYVYILTR